MKNRKHFPPGRLEIFIRDHPLDTVDRFEVVYVGRNCGVDYAPEDWRSINIKNVDQIYVHFKMGKYPLEKKPRPNEDGIVQRWPLKMLRIKY